MHYPYIIVRLIRLCFRQAETERAISDLFERADISNQAITLNRNQHLNWLVRLLIQGFPARYTSQDASQPWLMYFVLQSFQVLGVAFDPDTKKKWVLQPPPSSYLMPSQSNQDNSCQAAPQRRVRWRTRAIPSSSCYISLCLRPCHCRFPWSRWRMGSN